MSFRAFLAKMGFEDGTGSRRPCWRCRSVALPSLVFE
nr:MAG TPA: hypothetical protein [Caudoviricetes sp.]